MKKLFIGFAFILISNVLNAQNPSWSVTPNYIKFDPILPSQTLVLPTPTLIFNIPGTSNNNSSPYDAYDGALAEYASNMMVNPQGDIEFFIVDGFVYDGTGNYIATLRGEGFNGVMQNAVGASEIMIIPFPGDCKKYYIVSTVVEQGIYYKLPYLFILDMNIPNLNWDTDNGANCTFFGALVDQQGVADGEAHISIEEIMGHLEFTPPDPSPGKRSAVFLASTKERPNGSRLAFISNGDGFFTFLVDQNGFQATNFTYFGNPGFNPEAIRGEMEVAELANGNYRIAVPYMPANAFVGGVGVSSYLYTAELNSNGILVPTSEKRFPFLFYNPGGIDNSARIKGTEFSEDGNILYVTHSTNVLQLNQFEFYDFSNPTPDLIPVPSLTSQDFQSSMLERGFNNQLYLANQNGLHFLLNGANPNSGINLASSFAYLPNYEGELSGSKETYMLPDQIDGMDYTANIMEQIECCLDNQFFHAITRYDVNTTLATWQDNAVGGGSNPLIVGTGNTILVRKEIRIKAGKTLTIKNMILQFAPGARIVIENGSGTGQGGKLILDGTTLTNDFRCDATKMWLGVEVWGNQSLTQHLWNNSTQGRLEMKNNSKIENALIGVLAGKRTSYEVEVCENVFEDIISDFAFDDLRNGGIFQIKNSFILNNQRGIWARKYINPTGSNNLSFAHKTDFRWNGLLLGNLSFQALITLDDNKGVQVKGCSFINNAQNSFAASNQGIGIFSRQSQFFVDPYCNMIVPNPCLNAIPSTFTNLSYGIYATNTDALTYSVNQSKFENCVYGIYTKGTNNERITLNEFKVKENTYFTAGVAIYNSTGYFIQQNEFFEHDDPTIINGTGNSYGLVVNSSGTLQNEVYNNYFHDLKIGGQSEKINGTLIPFTNVATGLQWKCNRLKAPIYLADFGVNGVINRKQGYANQSSLYLARMKAARNEFSMFGENQITLPDHDIMFFPGSQTINYVHLADNGQTPDNVDPLVIVVPALFAANPVWNNGNTCPSLLNTPINALQVQLVAAKAELQLLNNKLDGGNNSNLLNLIANENNPNVVLTALLEKSPFLSDNVLSAYLESVNPSGMKKEVLLANSKLSDSLISEVINSNLPNGMKNQILAAQTGVSERTLLFDEISYVDGEFQYLYNNILSQMLLDTTSTITYDQVILFLNEINSEKSKKTLLDVYVEKQDFANASQLKSILQLELTDQDFFDFHDIKVQIRTAPAVAIALQTQQQLSNELMFLDSSSINTQIQARAQVLLELIDGISEVPDFLPLSDGTPKMALSIDKPIIESVKAFNVVNVYPNPSSGIVNFDLPDLDEGNLTISIFELSGKALYSISFSNTNGERVDLSHIQKGTYLVKISIDDTYAESQLIQLK